jgi:hypothetical protein
MSNYDRYLANETNSYLDSQDDLDDEYEYAEDCVRRDMLDLAPDAKYGTYYGDEFCSENLVHVQPALLNALVRGDDAAVLKILYTAFEKEVDSLTQHLVENK